MNFSGTMGTIFKLIFVIHLVLYIPGDYVIMRYSCYKVLGGDASEADDLTYFSSTLIALSLATFLSSLIQIYYSTSYSIALVLGLTGGIANSIFGFILPAVIAIRLLPRDKTVFYLSILLFILGCSIPFFVIISIIEQYSTLKEL